MATNPTSTGPFTWSGPGTPPDNINKGDHLLSDKINEIKDNADFLEDNTESCFNEKINMCTDRDSIRRDIRYDNENAQRRTTVNTSLDSVRRSTYLYTVWSTANTGRKDIAYTHDYTNAYDNRCGRCNRLCLNKKNSRRSVVNVNNFTNVGVGCSGKYATYHSGRQNTVQNIVNSTAFLTVNGGHNADDHSARHNVFCSVLT